MASSSSVRRLSTRDFFKFIYFFFQSDDYKLVTRVFMVRRKRKAAQDSQAKA